MTKPSYRDPLGTVLSKKRSLLWFFLGSSSVLPLVLPRFFPGSSPAHYPITRYPVPPPCTHYPITTITQVPPPVPPCPCRPGHQAHRGQSTYQYCSPGFFWKVPIPYIDLYRPYFTVLVVFMF